MKTERILMVCLGNICRSPVAHGILREKVENRGLNAYVDSAGTSAYHLGESPDSRSAANAISHGIDISDLKARQFVTEDFDEFDRIYAMDASNYQNILSMARNRADEEKVEMILNTAHPGENRPVPDPYFGSGDSGFERVFNMLDEACEVIASELNSKA